MPVVSFFTGGKDQAGNTVSAIAFATYLGVTQNKKTLLVSTAYKDKTMQEAFWPSEEIKNRAFLKEQAPKGIGQSGIEDLDRVVRSNRVSANIITDYTKVVLRGRLEVLDSYTGTVEQYNKIQASYPKIINLATGYYDTVIVDMDNKGISNQNKIEILKESDVIIAMTTQKLHNITRLKNLIETGNVFDKDKTLIVIGKYDGNIKYNVKNISRNVLKQRQIINSFPYNSLVFESVQEGKIIDAIWKLTNLKNQDENYLIIEELQRLSDTINNKVLELRMKK